jgi:hypothetical protein
MMMRVFAALVCCWTLGLAPAQAHFIWIDLAPAANGQPQARLYFSETPEPHLVHKIAHTKAWVHAPEGEGAPLAVGKPEGEDSGLLPLSGADPAAGSLEAECDYGVYERGPGVLLHYYAKRLPFDWATRGDKLTRAPKLLLDIVPRLSGRRLEIEVLYDGEPSCASGVVVVDPKGDEHDLKTDDKGRVAIEAANAGRYAIRAAHIETDKSGQRDGKRYAQTWHYATLLLDVRPTASDSAAANLSAAKLLKRARQGRAVWTDFPGVSADLTISNGSEHVEAKATIDKGGSVELDMAPSKLADWVEEQLNTLVQHRMLQGEVAEGEVRYADQDESHPLGRKIHLGDGQDSAYRIKDDMIMEVNRSAGKVRFTISVLEFVRNPENKYLPRAFTMNFFDSASGALTTSLGYWNDWQRVGSFDLPKTILEISAGPGGTATRQIVFSNCKLLEKK